MGCLLAGSGIGLRAGVNDHWRPCTNYNYIRWRVQFNLLFLHSRLKTHMVGYATVRRTTPNPLTITYYHKSVVSPRYHPFQVLCQVRLKRTMTFFISPASAPCSNDLGNLGFANAKRGCAKMQ